MLNHRKFYVRLDYVLENTKREIGKSGEKVQASSYK